MPPIIYVPIGIHGYIRCPVEAEPPVTLVKWNKDGRPLRIEKVTKPPGRGGGATEGFGPSYPRQMPVGTTRHPVGPFLLGEKNLVDGMMLLFLISCGQSEFQFLYGAHSACGHSMSPTPDAFFPLKSPPDGPGLFSQWQLVVKRPL